MSTVQFFFSFTRNPPQSVLVTGRFRAGRQRERARWKCDQILNRSATRTDISSPALREALLDASDTTPGLGIYRGRLLAKLVSHVWFKRQPVCLVFRSLEGPLVRLRPRLNTTLQSVSAQGSVVFLHDI